MMDVLKDRVISSFPISIGTALAMESLFKGDMAPYDPKRSIPNNITPDQYDELWLNISTIIRNLVQSVASNKTSLITVEDITTYVKYELDIIYDLLKKIDKNKTLRVYYTPMDDFYKKVFPKGIKIRIPSTQIELTKYDKFTKAINSLMQEAGNQIITFKPGSLKPTISNKVLLLTHSPIDLINWSSFKELMLLESHTGILKRRQNWNSKYFPLVYHNMLFLPFNAKLLQIFGDHYLFYSSDINFRKEIYNIAKDKRWTPLTTDEKIDLDVNLNLKISQFFGLWNGLSKNFN